MRDAYIVSGEKIIYKESEYIIGNFYFIPNNPELYVELKKNGCCLNVRLRDVIQLIITIPKSYC